MLILQCVLGYKCVRLHLSLLNNCRSSGQVRTGKSQVIGGDQKVVNYF